MSGLILIFIFYFSPDVSIKAVERSLLIKQYKVNAEILSSGDMKVEELINFSFMGSYNGITKQLILPEGSEIENLTVSEGEATYKKVISASKGDSNVFTVENQQSNSLMLWIYKTSVNTQRNFSISYVIKSACRKYNDTAELYWKFIGVENQTPMESVCIDIALPEGSLRNNIKIFAHGPLTGKSTIVGDRNVCLSINNLPNGRYVEARILFPTELIPQTRRYYQEDKLQSILNEEASLADRANRERQKARNEISSQPDYRQPTNPDYTYNSTRGAAEQKRKETGIFISVIAAITAACIAYYMKKEYGTDPVSDFNGKYYREVPGDYPPAVMSILYYYHTGIKDLTATLMNLIRRKYLKLKVVNIQKKRMFSTKYVKDYDISRLKAGNGILQSHEEFLMNWLLSDFGDGNSFSFSSIKDKTNGRREAQCFREKYNTWIRIVEDDAQKYDFFEKTDRKAGLTFGLSIAAYIIIIIFVAMICLSLESIVFLTGSIFILVAVQFMLRQRTQYGSNQFARWKGFRNFLIDFSNLKEAETPSLVLWEHYLVYAISFDIAKKVLEQLKIIIPNEQFGDPMNKDILTYLYIYHGLNDRKEIFDTFHDISNAFTQITDSAISMASSTDSSSSGSGGGFSGGGFGGGGGDSGGGFGGF